MNILTQIAPGVREARTPAAIGTLWAIIVGIACSFAPAEVWDNEFFTAAAGLMGNLPTEVVIAAGALIVYLVGVLMQSIGAAVSKMVMLLLYTIVVLSVIPISFLLLIVALAIETPGFIVMLAGATAILLFYAQRRHQRLKSGSFWRILIDTVHDVFQRASIEFVRTWRKVREPRETRRAIFREMLLDSLERYFASNPTLLERKVQEFPHSTLHEAALTVGITPEEATATRPQAQPLPPEVRSLGDLRWHLADWDEYDTRVRAALLRKLVSSREAREALTEVLELSAYWDWVRRRLEQADHELRAMKPELFLEYDRMRSEGEFRSAVSFPLASLISICAYKWHVLFNSNGTILWLGVLLGFALIVWVVVYRAGSQQKDNAKRLLYLTVRNGTIQLPQEAPFGDQIFVPRPVPDVRHGEKLSFLVKRRFFSVFRRLRKTANPGSASHPVQLSDSPPPRNPSHRG